MNDELSDRREALFARWAHHYRTIRAEGTEPMWPSENLIRMFKGPYIPGLDKHYEGRDVLDVGCGNGNNLVFLGSLGLRLFGTEVDEGLAKQTASDLAERSFDACIRLGTNRDLPFPDNRFDYLVSWNVIHYETNDADVRSALREYQRVLRPGGRLFLSTTGPDHLLIREGELIEPHVYRVNRGGDFRAGQLPYCFETTDFLREMCATEVRDVLVGRTTDELFTDTLDWLLATGLKSGA